MFVSRNRYKRYLLVFTWPRYKISSETRLVPVNVPVHDVKGQNLPPRDMECPRGDAVGVAVFGRREPRVPVPAGVPAVFESRKSTGTAGESVYF